MSKRLYVSIDSENLYAGTKDEFGRSMRIDYLKFLKFAIQKRDFSSVKAVAYVVTDYTKIAKDFISKIKKFGYEVVLDRAETKGTSKVDAKLVLDTVKNLDFDVFVLGSGDGDFLELFKFLKEKGKRVEIICCKNDLDRRYLQVADSVRYVNEGILYETDTGKEKTKSISG